MAGPAPAPEEIEVDLHGVTLEEVGPRLEAELRSGFFAKARRAVIVHGIGNHSEQGSSPLAQKVREYLKALLDTPRAAIARLEFGEESRELRGNAGCVRVTFALQIARSEVAFVPKPVGRKGPRPIDRRKLARRAAAVPAPQEKKALEQAEEELRRRFGSPGLDGPYRPASEGRGEWPGQR